MTAKPRIALIGAGAMGSLHARVVHQSGIAQLHSIIEKNPETGKAAAERYETDWYSDLSKLAEVDAVILAAPTEFHFDIASEVLRAEVPLLIEKPVSDSLDRTLTLIDYAREVGVPLMCGLLERYNPAVLTAMAMISEPSYFTATRHSPYAPRIKTGVAWDLLIHDVDLACQLFGGIEPSSVQGLVAQSHPSSLPGADDIAEALLEFGPNQIAHISASRTSQRKIRTLSIQDSDKLIEADLLRRDVTVYRHVSDQPADEEGRGYRQQTVIEIPELVSMKEPLLAQLEHFVQLVNGKEDAEAEIRSLIPAHAAVNALKSR